MFINIVFWLGSDYWEAGWFFIFGLFKSISFFGNWISLFFFHIFIKYYRIMFIFILLWLGYIPGRVDDLSFFDYLIKFLFFVNWISLYFFHRWRVDDLSFFEYLRPFCCLSINFHSTFSISYKILPSFVYYYCI